MMAADGSMDAQIEYLTGKAEEFATYIRLPSPTNKYENWMAYKQTIYKAMEYQMPVTELTQKEWDDIYWKINAETLPKCGMVKSFPKNVLYGPIKYQGLGGPMSPNHNQDLEQLKCFVQQVNSETTCGTRMRITTEQLRLDTGFPGPFTDAPYHCLDQCTTSSWIKALWHKCHRFDISIHDSFGDFQLARLNDIFLMPLFEKMVTCTMELAILNACRIFLEVATLADICTMAGDRISENA